MTLGRLQPATSVAIDAAALFNVDFQCGFRNAPLGRLV